MTLLFDEICTLILDKKLDYNVGVKSDDFYCYTYHGAPIKSNSVVLWATERPTSFMFDGIFTSDISNINGYLYF